MFTQRFKNKLGFKILYFWFFVCIILYTTVTILFWLQSHGFKSVLPFIFLVIFISIPTLLGIYGYAYQKAILKPIFFKILFCLIIILLIKNILDFLRGYLVGVFLVIINSINLKIIRNYIYKSNGIWNKSP